MRLVTAYPLLAHRSNLPAKKNKQKFGLFYTVMIKKQGGSVIFVELISANRKRSSCRSKQ